MAETSIRNLSGETSTLNDNAYLVVADTDNNTKKIKGSVIKAEATTAASAAVAAAGSVPLGGVGAWGETEFHQSGAGGYVTNRIFVASYITNISATSGGDLNGNTLTPGSWTSVEHYITSFTCDQGVFFRPHAGGSVGGNEDSSLIWARMS